MYTIVAVVDGKEYPIHNLKSRRLIVGDPYFEIGDNLNGQAEFKVYAGHPHYGKVKKLTTDIIVRNDDEDAFYGRVLYDDEDSDGTKQVFVEGELAFLCDSVQRPRVYHNIGVRDYLTNVINIHNDQVEERKRFTVGRVTVEDANDSLYRFSNWETTRETLKDKLSDRLGGHFVIRRENSVRYIDYLSDNDYYSRCEQPIKFGKNLLSFARNFDATDLATCIIPLGTILDESSVEGLDERLTIKEANGGKDYVTDDAAVAAYGKIYRTIVFDDVTLPTNLKAKGQKYLTQTQYEKMALECKAIDLNFTDKEFERFTLGSLVHCVSKPHALDAWYPVTKQRFYLTDFKKNTITLGDESNNVSYTSSNRQSTATFREDLETYRTGLTERIEKARSDFKSAIENGSGLYSTDVEQENGSIVTYYHNKKDLESSSIRLVFNDAGFAVSNNAGEDWYGIKVDGEFIASVLNAMGVNAGWINTGVLRVTDAQNKEVLYVDVDAGVVRITPEMFALSSGETINSIVDAATNKKCSVFTSQPKPPYSAGDLWFNGSDILTCTTARKEGNYNKTDWEKKNDYIDQNAADTAASNAVTGISQTAVLNKLTNNGSDKAIYMINGKLYISFNAARGGELTLGGANNEYGIFKVKNKYGWDLVNFDNSSNALRMIADYSTVENNVYGFPFYKQAFGVLGIDFYKGRISNGNEIENEKTGKLRVRNLVSSGSKVHEVELYSIGGDEPMTAISTRSGEGEASDRLAYVLVYKDGVTVGPMLATSTIGHVISRQGTAYPKINLDSLRVTVEKQLQVNGSFSVSGGTKSKIADTLNYGERLLYCYEMPSPMFGDVGEGETDENGECLVYLDDIFQETIAPGVEYQVFLQKEGRGDIWVEEKNPGYFLVMGTANLKFAWEVKAKQEGFEYERLESPKTEEEPRVDYEKIYDAEISELIQEREGILYETA